MPGVSTAATAVAAGAQRAQRLQQPLGVAVDRADRLALEQLGEDPLGDGPVLQHVGDARGHPQVVLEDVDGAVGVAHEVGAADVGPHAVRRVDPVALGPEAGRGLDQLLGGRCRPAGSAGRGRGRR